MGKVLNDLKIRKAAEDDLPSILMLYAQPEMDDGKTFETFKAKEIYEKMKHYPNYKKSDRS